MDIKTKVEGILEDSGFREQRAAKMDINDILKYVQYVVIRAVILRPVDPDYFMHFTRTAYTSPRRIYTFISSWAGFHRAPRSTFLGSPG